MNTPEQLKKPALPAVQDVPLAADALDAEMDALEAEFEEAGEAEFD